MADTLSLTRWTVGAGSNVRSRGAVVISSGEHEWQASGEGNGAIDALYKAVDAALEGVLGGRARLLAFDIHALGEGSETVGEVKVRIAPPEREGARGRGEYTGQVRSESIVAASIEAYLQALNTLLAEDHWEGAAEEAGNRRRVRVSAGDAREQRAELDPEAGHIDTTEWFNQ